MKLNNDTIDILKNFSSINPSILVRPGDTIRTISLSDSVIAKAKLTQKFDNEFAIYDLPRFIAALSMFEDPDLDFDDQRFVMVSNADGTASIRYFFADSDTVKSPPNKEMAVPSDIKFTLTKDMLDTIQKATSVLDLPELLFTGDGKNIIVKAIDPKNPASSSYRRVIGDTEQEFQLFFKKENVRLFSNDYKVSVSIPKQKGMPGIAHFASSALEYWIVCELHSKF